jgi:hypothetical protein
VIKVYGATDALAAGAYRLLWNDERTAYTQIERLVDGDLAYWTLDHDNDAVVGAIAITGKWAAAAVNALPEKIASAWEAKAVRIFRRRGFQQGGGGGSSSTGTASAPANDKDLEDDVAPYWRPRRRQITRQGAN